MEELVRRNKRNTKIIKTDLPIYALDVNSKFEIEAGLKSVENIKKFKNEISTN